MRRERKLECCEWVVAELDLRFASPGLVCRPLLQHGKLFGKPDGFHMQVMKKMYLLELSVLLKEFFFGGGGGRGEPILFLKCIQQIYDGTTCECLFCFR